MSPYRHVSLDELATEITASVDQIPPVVVEGLLRDWHVSNTIGRGQLLTPDTRLQVIVRRWTQRHHLSEGNRVRVTGRVAWSPRYGLQLVAATSIEPIGVDEAHRHRRQFHKQIATSRIRQRELSAPANIRSVLILGPKNGSAAIRDAQSVFAPLGLQVIVSRIAMAGDNVATQLAIALTTHSDVDVVLVVRGGGAASDLAAFDSPRTVEVAASHRVPIVAGIGHTTNTTAFDLAVWESAPTPSLAAQAIANLAARMPADVVDRPRERVGPRRQPAPMSPVRRVDHPKPVHSRRVPTTAVVAVALLLIVLNVYL